MPVTGLVSFALEVPSLSQGIDFYRTAGLVAEEAGQLARIRCPDQSTSSILLIETGGKKRLHHIQLVAEDLASLDRSVVAAGGKIIPPPEGHVAEGVTSCESILALASSYDVEMPLTDAVHRVCHKGLSVDEAVALLLGRSTKPE